MLNIMAGIFGIFIGISLGILIIAISQMIRDDHDDY